MGRDVGVGGGHMVDCMRIAGAFLVSLFLVGCGDKFDDPIPDPAICKDWRMMTYLYQNDPDKQYRRFYGPYTKKVCVIAEATVEPPA